ncbi:phenylacetate--CoA ligase [Candidatus Poribacteria bacterium]|nr:phenylacetate--CoA ligase [Candidatus Poribacteria bacterium]
MIWSEYETLPREEIEQLQLERLQAVLNRVYRNVGFYRRLFDEAGISPEEITSLDDLGRIPFTDRETLRVNQPYGMFALPLREVVRLQTTSGTTGEPIVVGYSSNDVEHWTELMARSLYAAGVSKEDVVQIAFDYGLFTGALGFHYGAERIGATVIPCSRLSPEKQVEIMRNYKTTALACTPSFALQIAETVERSGVAPAELSLRVGIFGAEPWPESVREKIEDTLHITAIDCYGLSEVIGPGVSVECERKNGLHIFEDHFIAEVIDPSTGERLPDGQMGELVLTTITKEAFPLIRYRTGDLTSLDRSPCPCGRMTVRMSRVMERTDNMVVVRGVNIFPSQIERILAEIQGEKPRFEMVLLKSEGVPEGIEVHIEMSSGMFVDEVRKLMELEERMREVLEGELGIPVQVKLVEPRSIHA